MKSVIVPVILFLVSTGVFAAASQETYYPTAQILENDRREITDDDILRAFEAEPQLTFPLRIAWYDMGTDEMTRQISLTNIEAETRYYLPKTLIEGFVGGRSSVPTTLNLKALRLAAARAKCDVLVLVGTQYTISVRPNILAVFNILLIPMLFNPSFDVTGSATAEMYVIDVRNEYLYGQTTYRSDMLSRSFLTMARSDTVADELKEELGGDIAAQLSEEFADLVDRYR